MNLKSIEYFLAVAEGLNVTRTAERLNITQQALSGHIKRLEEEYSVTLFDRRPSFRLTEAGKRLVFYGQQILDSEASLRAAFSDISVNAKAALRFGISRLRSIVFFPLIWDIFKPSHPNISIELVDGNSNYFDRLLSDGKIDMYVGIDVPAGLNQHKILLAKEKLHCCFSERLMKTFYPDTYRKVIASFVNGVDITKILHLPFITLRQGNRLREALDQFMTRRKRPYYILECDEQGLIYDTAKTGLGIGILSPIMLYQHRNSKSDEGDRFYTFPILNDIYTTETYLVYRSDYTLPNYAMEFIRNTEQVFSEYAATITRSCLHAD